MQFFTTEMVFVHPPRTFAGRYTSPRRRRYGCRTMPRVDVESPEPRIPDRDADAMSEMTTASVTIAIDRAA